MSELLLRGWNVAVPVVDVGDDVLFIDDRAHRTGRLQVKTATAIPATIEIIDRYRKRPPWNERIVGRLFVARFMISRIQLLDGTGNRLFYMFLARDSHACRWRFVAISREELADMKRELELQAPARKGPGRPRARDEVATSDDWALDIVFDNCEATLGDMTLRPYLDRWPDDLPAIDDGPGSVKTPE